MIQKKIKSPVPQKPEWHYQLKGSKNKQFFFILRAPNNKTVMISETYKTKQACVKSLNAVQNAHFERGGTILDVYDLTV